MTAKLVATSRLQLASTRHPTRSCARPLALSVTLESLLLSLAGALAGAGLAWALFNGHESLSGIVLRRSVSPRLVALGIAWALALAVLGSLSPAIRAARLPVSVALHE